MAKISARGIKFLCDKHSYVAVTYKIGNCKIADEDIETLLRLGMVCREHPSQTIDCRTVNVSGKKPTGKK